MKPSLSRQIGVENIIVYPVLLKFMFCCLNNFSPFPNKNKTDIETELNLTRY